MKKETRKRRLGLRLSYVLMAMGEIVLAAVVALLLNLLLDAAEIALPPWLWVLVFSVVLSVVLGALLWAWIFEPITRLSRAMRSVGEGDFSIRLSSTSRIREVRDTYDNFNLMAQELQATEIVQSDFVSNVSHEFKTPINAIEGYATLLQSGAGEAEQAMYIEKILLNTHRLGELVSNVLLLSRLDNQAIQTAPVTYRLDEQIRRALVLLQPKWEEKQLELDVELAEMSYTGSESLLLHVWVNLMDNAIKFDPVGGLLRLRLRQEPGRAVFTVEDSGPGIPEAAAKHIYDKFYQADASHTAQGNGLGLALVKKVLHLSGGHIQAENLDVGCRFTVILPL